MQAIVYTRYGPPGVLQLQDVPKPVPQADQVLIQVHAVSLNRSDWEGLVGRPLYARLGGLRRPARHILGSDIAGRVVAVGPAHTRFKPGDEVLADILGTLGGFAEYVAVRGSVMALKPASMSFETASTIPQAGIIALQGIRTQGRVQPGQQVLINGAGGGTGVFAIQLAKLDGAEVTAVDNTGKLDFMRSLGADHVIDYTRDDFTRLGRQYDLILDLVGYRSAADYARALKPQGTYFVVGGSASTLFQVLLLGQWVGRAGSKRLRVLAVQPSRQHLETITGLVASGQVKAVIDRRYTLAQVPEALGHLGADRAKGKLVIVMDPTSAA